MSLPQQQTPQFLQPQLQPQQPQQQPQQPLQPLEQSPQKQPVASDPKQLSGSA